MKDYYIEVSLKPYDSELRETDNTFSYEQGEIISETLYSLVRKLGLLIHKEK